MAEKVVKVVWTRQAREALNSILEYRYKDVPNARKIVRSDSITSSKKIVFTAQYQRDFIYPQYRKINVRDYKILYKESKGVVYVTNVVCTLAK